MTDWTALFPEIFTLMSAGVFFVFSMYRADARRDFICALILSAIGLVVCAGSLDAAGVFFSGVYRVDLFSQVFKFLITTAFFLTVTLCGNPAGGLSETRRSEFYFLLFICTLSLMCLVGCTHLLTLYIALEMSSYSLYILVYLRKGREKGLESALKYFFIGASSSAVMLFGFALLHGAAGSLSLPETARFLSAGGGGPAAGIGVILALSGFLFKLAAFPFHFWAPDVYEGAPHPVAAYIATASKAAAVGVLLRIAHAYGAGDGRLVTYLIILSIVSMTLGNLAAVVQKDLKRLLAYSSIAHAGYVLIGVLSISAMGTASVLFYAVSLVVMKFTCFMAVVYVSPGGRNPALRHLAGLHERAPLLALALLTALFGLAGIPPVIGFTAKLLVFTAAMKSGYFALPFIAMANVVVSLYYYLGVLKAAYYDPAEPAVIAAQPSFPRSLALLSVLLILIMVAGGLYPAPLIDLAGEISMGLP
jgi:NADH-quinone oxidoreductase subunit N